MPAQQMHLFSPPRPLEERLDKGFFSAVPRSPGVYIMCGAGDRVLYVGQSGNLRARLGSYKNARLDRVPRKVIRLVHEVDSIVWEKCESPEAALLREGELLRLHRPKFNRIGTYPQARLFICLSRSELGFELGRAPSPTRQAEAYGPFKGAVPAHSALVRLLWTVLRQPASAADYPAGLLSWRIPPHQRILWNTGLAQVGTGFLNDLRSFLCGVANELVGRIETCLPNVGVRDACMRAMWAKDLEFLTEFYRWSHRGSPSVHPTADQPPTPAVNWKSSR